MVVNAAIAIMAKHSNFGNTSLTVYQFGSSLVNSISYGDMVKYWYDHFKCNLLPDSKRNDISISRMNFFNNIDDFSSFISNEMAKKNVHYGPPKTINTHRKRSHVKTYFSDNEKPEKIIKSVIDIPKRESGSERKQGHGIGIARFLQGKNYFITGATGFVGKVLVEKMLRTAPDVGKIFVLIKAKDKEAALNRLKTEIIESELLKSLEEVYGVNYKAYLMKKLVAVSGCVCESDIGMDPLTANEIATKVNVIVNSAASTNFDERYDVALNTNTKGPFGVLNFAKKCKNLCLLFHISTAYVGDGERQGIIMEKPLYIGQGRVRAITEQDIDFELELASEMLDSLQQDQATQKMKELGMKRANMYGWPNTYSLTKAMGEMLINSFRDGIPMVILRPSVVESSYSEPFPGWIQGYRVLDPLIFNYGKGQLPGFLGDPNAVIDVIPVDMVVNATMAAIAKHGAAATPDLSIYHIGSSVANPISFGALFDYARSHFKSFPLAQSSNGNQSLIQKMNFLDSLDDFSYISMEMARQTGLLHATKIEPDLHKTLQKKSAKKAQLFIHMAKLYEPYMFYKAW
ncbi:fatty acyl-CoA reductase 2-like [Neltuma alba]|uniref:fatty acyl-CoA reductase 2-like n=1 Tax=Neltuma alba TaxID=207710 RepID=UPI0010A3B590|nr:fatty acyl-CoA reductase 2-like [Prosopis alba]